jgi:Flp pilus assembly protein TadD
MTGIAMLRAAADRDPTNAEIHFRLGCHLWRVGDVEDGLRELEIAVQLNPGWDKPAVEIARWAPLGLGPPRTFLGVGLDGRQGICFPWG